MTYEGVIPALVTPFDKEAKVSVDTLRALVEAQIKAGVHGLYVCGAGGEGLLLSTEERKKAVETVMSQAKGRVPVVVHVGSLSTACAVELAAHARKIDADAVASVPPFFYKVSMDGIMMHYRRIAEASGLPVMLYNLPTAVGYSVTPDMMETLMQIPGVTAMKFSSKDLFSMRQILELENGRLKILSGIDEIFLAALVMGAHGGIGTTYNFMPRIFVDIFSKYHAGEIKEAQELQFFATRAIGIVLKYPVLPAVKEVLAFKGMDCGLCRGPLEMLTERQRQCLRDDLEGIRFFEKNLGL